MRAGIALGSNLGDRLASLRQAWQECQRLPKACGPYRVSRVYETDPVDTAAEAGPFLNAVAEFEYTGLPAELLQGLHRIEAGMGRPSKRPRNASRSIDLDLLFAGNQVLATAEIMVPHPRISQRRFVLQPLHDLSPDLRLPGREQTVKEMLAALPPDGPAVRLCPHDTLS